MPSWSGGCCRRRRRATASQWLPDWTQVRRELRRKAMTLMLVWEEHKEAYPRGDPMSGTGSGRRHLLVMRQEHGAGEKTLVDYAGCMVVVVDRETGEMPHAQVFFAELGGVELHVRRHDHRVQRDPRGAGVRPRSALRR